MDESANHYFYGLTFVAYAQCHNASSYIRIGNTLSINLVSARFDVGNAYFDQNGKALNSWQFPARLTSADVDINGTVSTFSMANMG